MSGGLRNVIGTADRHSHWLTGQKHRFSLGLSDHLPGVLSLTHRMSWGSCSPHLGTHYYCPDQFSCSHDTVLRFQGGLTSTMGLHGDTLIFCRQGVNPMDSWIPVGKREPFPSKEEQGTFVVGKYVWMQSGVLSGGTGVDHVQS